MVLFYYIHIIKQNLQHSSAPGGVSSKPNLGPIGRGFGSSQISKLILCWGGVQILLIRLKIRIITWANTSLFLIELKFLTKIKF